MIDLSRNTLVRRYTKTDIFGMPNCPGSGLSAEQVRNQNIQCGFRYNDTTYPIVKTQDIDSIYFMQGKGKVKVAEPRITDTAVVERTAGSRVW
jgi:hypothetical protein